VLPLVLSILGDRIVTLTHFTEIGTCFWGYMVGAKMIVKTWYFEFPRKWANWTTNLWLTVNFFAMFSIMKELCKLLITKTASKSLAPEFYFQSNIYKWFQTINFIECNLSPDSITVFPTFQKRQMKETNTWIWNEFFSAIVWENALSFAIFYQYYLSFKNVRFQIIHF